MAQALLKAVNITKSFAGVQALKGVSLEIMPGEIHCLAGENGCGKSTLIKVISGVHPRDGGTLEFNGQPMDKFTPIDAIMAGVQVIYQDFAVFPNLTVMENLALNTELAAKRKIVSKRRMRQIAEDAIAKIERNSCRLQIFLRRRSKPKMMMNTKVLLNQFLMKCLLCYRKKC